MTKRMIRTLLTKVFLKHFKFANLNGLPQRDNLPLDFFTKKCRHGIHKIKFNRNTKFSNLFSEDWVALKNLSKRNDIVVKSADKGGAVVVCRSDLYQKEALRQLSDTSFYAKIQKDVTSKNQKLVKDTIQNLIVNQELPDTATTLIIKTPKTSCIYFLPKIHRPNNPGRPIVSACSCPTELISSYLDRIMTPIVKSLPSYIKDSTHALKFSAISISPAKTNLFSPWTLHLCTQSFAIAKVFKHLNTFSINALSRGSSETLLRLTNKLMM